MRKRRVSFGFAINNNSHAAGFKIRQSFCKTEYISKFLELNEYWRWDLFTHYKWIHSLMRQTKHVSDTYSISNYVSMYEIPSPAPYYLHCTHLFYPFKENNIPKDLNIRIKMILSSRTHGRPELEDCFNSRKNYVLEKAHI